MVRGVSCLGQGKRDSGSFSSHPLSVWNIRRGALCFSAGMEEEEKTTDVNRGRPGGRGEGPHGGSPGARRRKAASQGCATAQPSRGPESDLGWNPGGIQST